MNRGIEERTDSRGVTRYRAYVRMGNRKTRGPWTASLDEAKQHRVELLGPVRAEREAAVERMLYHGAGKVATQGAVYFVQAGDNGPVKIGHSRGDIETRIQGMQIHNHEELRLLGVRPGTMSLEKRIHRTLAAHHLRGEWYRPRPEVLAAAMGELVG